MTSNKTPMFVLHWVCSCNLRIHDHPQVGIRVHVNERWCHGRRQRGCGSALRWWVSRCFLAKEEDHNKHEYQGGMMEN
jgi:hypothetical protein